MAIGTTAAILGGAALGSAVLGSKAAKKASSQQAEAAANASAQQQEQYNLTREDLLAQQAKNEANYSPFLQTGQAANSQIGYLMGLGGNDAASGMNGDAGSLAKKFTMADYEADPGYAFRLAEGQKALERASAAGGKYFSGQAIKGLTDYNQQSASQEYQSAYDRYNTNQSNLYNRLAGLSTAGQNAASGLAGSGANTQSMLSGAGENKVNQIGENTIGAGNSRAAGTIGSNQAWVTGLGNTASVYGMDKGFGKEYF